MMREKDVFRLSFGNKRVLEAIPSMMEDKKFRRELRKLVLEFMVEKDWRNMAFIREKNGMWRKIDKKEIGEMLKREKDN